MNYSFKNMKPPSIKNDLSRQINKPSIHVHTLNPSESKYYQAKKDTVSEIISPGSSNSIATPGKYTNNNKPVPKDLLKEKSLSNSSYKSSESSNFSKSSLTQPSFNQYKSQQIDQKFEPNSIYSKSVFASNFKMPSIDEKYSNSGIANYNYLNNISLEKSTSLGGYNQISVEKQYNEPFNLKNNGDNSKYKEINNYNNNNKFKIKRGMSGLRNIGNTCFLNSTLQCIFNTPAFSDFFLDGSYQKEINDKNNKGIAEEFASLIRKVRSPNNSSAESTFGLKNALSKFSSKFSGYDQEDAQEFLRTLLEGLLNDLNRVTKKPKYKELSDDLKNQNLQDLSNEWFNYFKSFDDSLVNDYFAGQFLSKIICKKCGKSSIAFDNFLDLSLSFTRGLKIVADCDLERLIEQFFKEEDLEDDLYKCMKCGKTNSCKKLSLWRLPKILVVHLKRFNFGKFRREKIDTYVRFPVKNLDLNKFVTDSTDPSCKDCAVYDLFGIVNHSGSLYGGHYTSESLNVYDGKWYKYNDEYVSETNLESKDYATNGSANTYLLFYAKKTLF